MKILKTISDIASDQDISDFRKREAARAVLFDENNLVPILFVSKLNYHKLPGGGIEDGESKENALKRECLEEVGSKIEVKDEIGKIIEFRLERKMKQISYCYYGKVISKGEPDFTEKELIEGFKIIWVTLEQAVELLKNDKPTNYTGSFIQQRDLEFLYEVNNILNL